MFSTHDRGAVRTPGQCHIADPGRLGHLIDVNCKKLTGRLWQGLHVSGITGSELDSSFSRVNQISGLDILKILKF